MGQLLAAWRLIRRDLRRHPGETLLFLLAVTVAATALTLGVATDDAVTTAYAKTRAATAGPDILMTTTDPDPADYVERLRRIPEVRAVGGPFFAYDTTVGAHGRSVHAGAEGRDGTRPAVDRPLVTSGGWVRPGGVVVERGFARELEVRVGDRVTVGGREMPVVGTAISAATGVYPWSDRAQGPGPSDWGGMVWLTDEDARALAGDDPGVRLIQVKLADPDATDGFGDRLRERGVVPDGWFNVLRWQNILRTDTAMIQGTRPTLVVGGTLLAVAAIVTLTALAVGRTARDNRRAALLKVVGAGPGTITAGLLAQYLLLTVLATALGLTAGTLAAPHFVDPSDGLLNTASAPAPGTVLSALALAAAVAGTGAIGPALRATRFSTVHALADPAHLLTHHPRLNAVTAYLPTSLLLGVRLLARRPGRAVLAGAGAAATAAMITALLAWYTALAAAPDALRFGPLEVRTDRTGQTLLAVTLTLVALSTLNTVLLGWSTAVQARRALTISRTLGATPGQVVTALCVAQLLPAVPGVAVGMPAGLGLYWLFGETYTPPASWLLAAAAGILAAVAALTALPAWVHSRSPAAGVLHSES
ncbi:hypothetical protein SRB5_40090 [Streptomyces sp. RB5]|uniref:ABC transporter permease n=1 Tax=Streptomyces smaragdinus TaxID=2585196 RepID=A0A7K0CKS9_9ACTN|nr:ABC transporter permease [Streptomyces smaragdinus]MQY13853.1 hypothetical protein [Streptomyces smaragdinus]